MRRFGDFRGDGPPAFLHGANLPWLRYGGDFGANAWSPGGGLATHGVPPEVHDDLARLRAGGAAWLRWFVLCDGRAGIRFDGDGTPLGVDDHVRADLDVALDLAASVDLRLVLTLFDFHWFAAAREVSGVQLGGRRRVIARRTRRTALIDRVVAPIVAHVGAHPALGAWDVINEPEWATFGIGTFDPRRSIRRSVMRAFIREVAGAARAAGPAPVTVGSAHVRGLDLVRGLGLDFYQVHWYDHLEADMPLTRPVSALALDGPVVLGEFPTRGSRRDAAAILDVARAAGYAGGWFWSVRADDTATDREAAVLAFGAAPAGAGTPTAGQEG